MTHEVEWTCEEYDVKVIQRTTIGKYRYLKVEILGEHYWTLSLIIRDKFPIVIFWMKKFFGIPTLGAIITKIKGHRYMLHLVSDPFSQIPIKTLVKTGGITDEVKGQFQRILAFRQIMFIKTLSDVELLCFKDGNVRVIYSIIESTTNDPYYNSFLIEKWFGSSMEMYIREMLEELYSEKVGKLSPVLMGVDRFDEVLSGFVNIIDSSLIVRRNIIIEHLLQQYV